MIFCKGEGKYVEKGIGYQNNHHVFNKPVSEDEYRKAKDILNTLKLKLPITKMVDGKLKTQSYKDAWKEMWEGMSQDDKSTITSIIHFDAELFEDITGIEVDEEPEEMTVAQVCEALGKNIKIVK